MDALKQQVRFNWIARSHRYIQEIAETWAGTGDVADRLVNEATLSLGHVIDVLREADDVWPDANPLCLNGRIGPMTFGVIAHSNMPTIDESVSPDLAAWYDFQKPVNPVRWYVHS